MSFAEMSYAMVSFTMINHSQLRPRTWCLRAGSRTRSGRVMGACELTTASLATGQFTTAQPLSC